MLPPLPVHCVALDGETATMPVIFEDHYQEPFVYKKKHQEETTSSPTNGMHFFRLMSRCLKKNAKKISKSVFTKYRFMIN